MPLYKSNQPFKLESGSMLPEVEITYTTYGKRKPDGSNVVWVCHALTANSDPAEWWDGLVGEHKFYNPEEHFIVCANILGSCYGTTGPLSINPLTSKKYYHDFPLITVRDMVKAHELLRHHLGINHINTLIGGSLGGLQVLEWAISNPTLTDKIILIAVNSQSSPWGIAFREAQRLAIEADPTWKENRDNAGSAGLKAARSVALLSYRSYESYAAFQSETDNDKINNFKASSYQQYQGDKLVKRFNAFTYYTLSKAMDTHNVNRGRENALKEIKADVLVIGISSDTLFPVTEQQTLAAQIPNATFEEVKSLYGHDGFLIEAEQISSHIKKFNHVKKTIAL